MKKIRFFDNKNIQKDERQHEDSTNRSKERLTEQIGIPSKFRFPPNPSSDFDPLLIRFQFDFNPLLIRFQFDFNPICSVTCSLEQVIRAAPSPQPQSPQPRPGRHYEVLIIRQSSSPDSASQRAKSLRAKAVSLVSGDFFIE